MCKRTIGLLKELFQKNINSSKKSSRKLEDKKANKQFYDDMETGVMDDDF